MSLKFGWNKFNLGDLVEYIPEGQPAKVEVFLVISANYKLVTAPLGDWLDTSAIEYSIITKNAFSLASMIEGVKESELRLIDRPGGVADPWAREIMETMSKVGEAAKQFLSKGNEAG